MTIAPDTKSFLRPPALRPGDTVAAISLSSGLAQLFPHRYEAGKRQLSEELGLRVVEAPNALRPSTWLRAHPEARADDLCWALTNPEVQGIVSTIGGEDSVRILPHVDLDLIRAHPKVFLGFSDATITHVAFGLAKVVSFYGPAIMTDLAENGGMDPFVKRGLGRALMERAPFSLEAAPAWTEEFLDWADPQNQARRRTFQPAEGWVWLQGRARVEGRLVGGCADVLEMLKGTRWWPRDLLRGAVLCLETSEVVAPPVMVGCWLRNYGAQGVLEDLAALLLARPRGYTAEMKQALHRIVLGVLAEFGREDLPVVADIDFGHTSPQLTLPLGVQVAVDPLSRRVDVLEPGVA